MIKDKFKTARNEKGKPQVDNTETESKDNEIYLDFDGEGEAVILTDCKMIVEDAVRNERTANGNVNECTVRKLSKQEIIPKMRGTITRNHEMELPKEQIDYIKERILNVVHVVHETDVKDRKTLT